MNNATIKSYIDVSLPAYRNAEYPYLIYARQPGDLTKGVVRLLIPTQARSKRRI